MKSQFYALIEGSGTGCDYTIACNKDIVPLKASNLEEARAEVVQYLDDRGFCDMEERTVAELQKMNDESKFDSIQIVEVVNTVQFNIESWVNSFKPEAKKREDAAALKDKEKLFEKLKKELGK